MATKALSETFKHLFDYDARKLADLEAKFAKAIDERVAAAVAPEAIDKLVNERLQAALANLPAPTVDLSEVKGPIADLSARVTDIEAALTEVQALAEAAIAPVAKDPAPAGGPVDPTA